MMDAEDTLRKFYKDEADEILFDNLHFDSAMKERIMSRIHPEMKRTASNGWFRQLRVKWIYTFAVSAALIVLLIIVVPRLDLLPSTNTPPINTAAPLNSTFTDNPATMALRTWKLNSALEARKWYGDSLHLPAYTPDGYVNDRIVAYGTDQSSVNKVVFSYVDEAESYALIVEKEASLAAFENDEKIELHGAVGYIYSDEHIGTTLFWKANDNLYSIIGMLTREETIKVAQSIQP